MTNSRRGTVDREDWIHSVNKYDFGLLNISNWLTFLGKHNVKSTSKISINSNFLSLFFSSFTSFWIKYKNIFHSFEFFVEIGFFFVVSARLFWRGTKAREKKSDEQLNFNDFSQPLEDFHDKIEPSKVSSNDRKKSIFLGKWFRVLFNLILFSCYD